MKKIVILVALGNMLGGSVTFFYFTFFLPSTENNPAIPGYYETLFFLAAMTMLSLMSYPLFKRKSVRALYEVANGS